jgi:hypothetical protein
MIVGFGAKKAQDLPAASAALAGEVKILWRAGLPQMYAVIALLYTLLFLSLPREAGRYGIPVFFYMDPATLGMFFVPSQILLIKDQMIFRTLAVLPAEPAAIFRIKLLAYTLLSVVAAVIPGCISGWPLETLAALPSLIAVSLALTMAGPASGCASAV